MRVARENTPGSLNPVALDDGVAISPSTLPSVIDHTLLAADGTALQVQRLCEEAMEWGFASVCVNGCHVAHAEAILRGTGVQVCTVVGFPLGAMDPRSKAYEAEIAVGRGAAEIDMVINIGALKDADYRRVRDDIEGVVRRADAACVKVIIETCALNDEEKVAACAEAQAAGAHFVKTSTGFGSGGATESDVRLMRRVVGNTLGVKASGGIRTYRDAMCMVQAGANRLGCSAGVSIVTRARQGD